MLTADTLIVVGCIALGGATFLKLLGGARMVAVIEAQRLIADQAVAVSPFPAEIPEVSGVDSDEIQTL